MQSLDVISVNFWQIIISLSNLLILYLLLKKFLYEPVRKFIAAREKAIEDKISAADLAESNAKAAEAEWNEKISGARKTADEMIASAARKADRRGDEIIRDAQAKADGIVAQAQADAEQEKKKAEAEIRQEIVDISSLMTEKILGREINTADHKGLIDSMISQIGDNEG